MTSWSPWSREDVEMLQQMFKVGGVVYVNQHQGHDQQGQVSGGGGHEDQPETKVVGGDT